MAWSASQYLIFGDERTRPVRDLLNAVSRPDAGLVADLGCGPGNSTEMLVARFPSADVIGVDSSADMIAAARARLPAVRFELAAIEHWAAPGPIDVLLSNAALHWVPDHAALLPRLVGMLSAGGTLAVQMPDNLDEPSHRWMREVAASGPWAGRLAGAAGARTIVERADSYYALLRPQCGRVDVWRTTYHHPLAGVDALVEWFEGSGSRPFLVPLRPAEQADFLDRYRSGIAGAYPALSDGTVLLPFPRLFIVATR